MITQYTQQQAVDAFLRGEQVLCVEYRGSRVEPITYSDKSRGGERVHRNLIKHSIEAGDRSMTVTEWTDDSFKPELFKPPFVKGARCVLTFTGFDIDKGNIDVRGKLVPMVVDKGPIR